MGAPMNAGMADSLSAARATSGTNLDLAPQSIKRNATARHHSVEKCPSSVEGLPVGWTLSTPQSHFSGGRSALIKRRFGSVLDDGTALL